MSRKWLIAVVVLVPMISRAQGNSDSTAYRRAQTLVNDGNATMGRAIVDSMIARAAPGTNAYAEGLYWRGVLSATAADAEMDYRRIIVDYPLSPRVEDVLLRLAQLELARADYDGALQHLNRLTLEHPGRTARVLFEKNDIQKACAANADALSRTGEADAELRNQISYLNQRCVGIALATAPPITPAPLIGTGSDSTKTIKLDSSAGQPTPPTKTPAAVQPTGVPQKSPMQLPATPKDAKPTLIEPPAKERYPVIKAAEKKTIPSEPSSGEGKYSVQVAAYNVKSQAEAMAAKLKKNGYEARVSGTSAPFRVRIGRYATEAQASAVMRSLKAKQITGFVVKAESQ